MCLMTIQMSLFEMLNDPLIQKWKSDTDRGRKYTNEMNWYWLRSRQVCTVWMINGIMLYSSLWLKPFKSINKIFSCCDNTHNDDSYHIRRSFNICFLPFINQFFHIAANKRLYVSLYLAHIVCYFPPQRCTASAHIHICYSSFYAWINFYRIVKRIYVYRM